MMFSIVHTALEIVVVLCVIFAPVLVYLIYKMAVTPQPLEGYAEIYKECIELNEYLKDLKRDEKRK